MNRTDISSHFEKLRKRWEQGEIHFEQFKQALIFYDESGVEWRLDLRGQWRRYQKEEDEGVLAEPLSSLRPKDPTLWDIPAPPPPSRRLDHRLLFALASGILILVVIATLGVIVLSLPEKLAKETAMLTKPTSVIPSQSTLTCTSQSDNTSTATLSIEPSTTATLLPSPSPTLTNTPSPTASPRATATPTRTATPSPTQIATSAPTETRIPTPTTLPTATQAPTPTVASQTSPAPRPPTGPAGQIIFPVFDSVAQQINIYVADVSGGGSSRLLLTSASQPGMDRSQHRFTYRSWQNDNRGLFVRQIKPGSSFNLREDVWRVTQAFEAARLALSWDGETIVYPSKQSSDRRWRLYDVTGEMLRSGGQDVLGSAPTWLPDGQLVFNHCQANACGLYSMRPDGSNLRKLTDSPRDTNPDISPDGKSVAFMSQRDGNFELYLVPTGGGPIERLTHHNAHDALPTWSPDGRWIAFVSNRGEKWAIWAITPDGSQERLLFGTGGVPGGCPPHVMEQECGGWTEERLVWIP